MSAIIFPGGIITFPQRQEEQKEVRGLPVFPFSPLLHKTERPLFYRKAEGVPAELLLAQGKDATSATPFLLC